MWIVSSCGTHRANLAILGLGSGRKRNGQRKGKVTEILSLVRMQPLAWKKKRNVQSYKSRDRDLDLEHPVDARLSGDLETIIASLVANQLFSAIFLWEEGFSCHHKSARITWPLTLTLTFSTPWMHAYLETTVWKFGRNRAICPSKSDLRKTFTNRRTNGQMDGQIDRRQTNKLPTSSIV